MSSPCVAPEDNQAVAYLGHSYTIRQAVPCTIRPNINRLTLNMGTVVLRTLDENRVGNHCYYVRVCKTQAITYMDGQDWKHFLRDYGLQRGYEVSLKVIGSTVFATAAKRDLATEMLMMAKAATPLTNHDERRAMAARPARASALPAEATELARAPAPVAQ